MFTQCPDCKSSSIVDAATLRQADGMVRCGNCRGIFNAIEMLCDDIPDDAKISDQGIVAATDPETDSQSTENSARVRKKKDQVTGDLFAPNSREKDSHVPELFAGLTKSHEVKHRSLAIWLPMTFILLCMLLAQLAYLSRETLNNYPQMRPLLSMLCSQLSCQNIVQSSDQFLRLVSRDIRPHPSVEGALMITATIVNESNQAIPFPTLEITLSDLNERRVAMRRFSPGSYLTEQQQTLNGLTPGELVRLTFEAVDPGDGAMNYHFSFH